MRRADWQNWAKRRRWLVLKQQDLRWHPEARLSQHLFLRAGEIADVNKRDGIGGIGGSRAGSEASKRRAPLSLKIAVLVVYYAVAAYAFHLLISGSAGLSVPLLLILSASAAGKAVLWHARRPGRR